LTQGIMKLRILFIVQPLGVAIDYLQSFNELLGIVLIRDS